jgi:hypothetical protein
MIRIARLVFTFVLVAAGALLVAPSAMATAEVTRVTEVREIVNLCNGDGALVDVTVTFVLIPLPSGDQKLEVTAHGSATSIRGNKYVINQRLDFLIHTEGGVTNSIFTNTILAVSQGSEPNEFFTITANTATGESTLERRCVG